MTMEQTLRVTSIRIQNPRGFGGCIFSGKPVDVQGRVQDAKSYFVVKASASTLGGVRVEPGQCWKIAGESSSRVREVNSYQVIETQIAASSAILLRPSGEHIVAFMAAGACFEGVGRVKAQMLWDAFGDDLYDHLDAGNLTELARVLTPDSAKQVVAAWAQHGDSRTLQWLQSQGFDLGLGRKVLEFFGAETAQKIKEDPYRLLSFCASWRDADALARSHFEVALDDPRRLHGAVEEACSRVFTEGHTKVLPSKLMNVLQGVLGSQTETFRWRKLIPMALSQGLSNGSFVVGAHGVHPLGALVMERQVAQAVAQRVLATDVPELMGSDDVDEILLKYEKTEGIELNPQQWEAVHLAATKPFVLITGGAGVGKTTVLKAIYNVYDRAGVTITQLALAGRAAKRMQEATSRPASTIANFLRSWKESIFDERRVVVVDEASMVDIITMSRLCELLGPRPRLVLVGDPAQLMPVGPGLVLHSLTQVPQVPMVQLTVVKRYGGSIAAAATDIREGRWPALPADFKADIAFIPCVAQQSRVASSEASLPEIVLRLYSQDPTNTQVLCARRNGPDGAKGLNALCQAALTAETRAVRVWDGQHDAYVGVGLHLGDPVLCTRNLWDRGLQNGSLGIVVQVEDEPRMRTNESGEEISRVLAWVDWDDGERRPIVEDMLDDLELGYAITVHKAQGSEWPRIIVPLTGHRLLDRTLVYTAVTRARRQVILVGDEAAVKAAVESQPRAQSRQVALDLLLRQALAVDLDDA
jgi:exodeoxyribonuclease V alpha subunit